MKRILLFLSSVILCISAMAQDIIIFTNGEEIQAKITEVGDDVVKYKSWSNLDGPTWTKKTSEIFMIRYENGTKQTFTTAQKTEQQQTPYVNNQQQYAYRPNQPTTIRFEVPMSVDFGAYVRGGYNWMFMQLSDGTISENYTMKRGSLSVGGYVECSGKQSVSSSYYDISQAQFFTTGFSLGLCYATRGGANKHFGSRDLDMDLRYLCLRPALAQRFYKIGGDYMAVIHYGFELGILTSATATSSGQTIDFYNACHNPSYGFFMDFSFTVSRYITLGGYFEVAFPMVKENAGIGVNSENIAIGISFGFDSAKKRVKKTVIR